jgi:outer membrane lipoprotein-sorting protein
MFKYLRSKFFLLCITSIGCNITFGQSLKIATEAQKNDILLKIRKEAQNTNSLECRFVQKKKLAVLSETVVSDGFMYFRKDNNLRWQYNKPYQYLFILSGGKVFIKNGNRTDKFDTNSNKMFREISDIMIGGVRGTTLVDNKKFDAQYFIGSATAVVKLSPRNKEMKQIMRFINLTFSTTDWTVKSIEMLEPGGDNTVITFTEKNVNKKIADDMFHIN